MAAASIIQDGTFLSPLVTTISSVLYRWEDWSGTNVTIVPAPTPMTGNYASMSMGTDFIQWFPKLANGTYQLNFTAQNPTNHSAELVWGVQQQWGIDINTTFQLGLGKEITLPANSGWIEQSFAFTVNNPGYSLNELFFSNSFCNPIGPISNSINLPGTFINISNVSLIPLSGSIPSSEALTITSAASVATLENASPSAPIYTTVTATTLGPDTNLLYSISGGMDASFFNINPSTGVISFKAPPGGRRGRCR